ncbi:hypothetical protein AAVH_07164 [Aphelenchoides avenae]|nr:hypothetical protein AAVH_07164 [Aphelenchus avenae]
MSGNQGSEMERGQQKAYEERTAPIRQHIRHLLDEHSRLTTLVRQNRPSAQDDVTRLIQRHAQIRPVTQLLRNYIVEYLQADTEWNKIIAGFRLYDHRSTWAQEMLHQRNVFYHGLSIASTPLDILFAELLKDAQHTLDDIERFIQLEPPRDVPPYPTASAQKTPHSGESGPLETPNSGDHAQHPTAAKAPTLTAHSAAPPNQSRSTGTRPNSSDNLQRSDAARGPRTFVNSALHRSKTTGVMGTTDGNVADTIPLAWKPRSDSAARQGATSAAPTTSTPAFYANIGAHAAETVCPLERPRPPPNAETEQKRQQMQQLFTTAVPGGRGPSNATSSNPLQVGADGRPFNSSTHNAAQAAASTTQDFGEDFARENSSSFYRNASFKRQQPQACAAQPSFVLKEIPLTPFDGEIRSYPEFRNRFLEIVEAQIITREY